MSAAAQQLELSVVAVGPLCPGNRYERAFWRFHRANPQVFALLVKFAREAKAANRKVGMRLLGERVRWELLLDVGRTDEFRCNDHLWPFYARLVERQCSDLRGFFEIRGRERAPRRAVRRQAGGDA